MSFFANILGWFSKLFGGAGESTATVEEGAAPAEKKARRRRKRKRSGKGAATGENTAFSSADNTASVEDEDDTAAAEKEDECDTTPSSPRGPLMKKKLGDWQAPPPPENPEEGQVYFQNFPFEREILKAAMDDLGFVKCTPIQGLALPAAMAGNDIAGRAQTGTGKTAVFLMAMIHQYLNSDHQRQLNQPFALVLAPTRELALQIANDADNLSVYTPLRTVAVYGGMDYERQRRLLQAGCDLVVATPGRLIDYLQKRVIDTSALKVLIIDEADRMLDMGFIPDVKRIINYLPKPEARQTMLFSATLSKDIMNLAERWMRPQPTVVEVEPEKVVADGIHESVYACTAREKLPIMLWILAHEECGRVMIFGNRRRDVEHLYETLVRYGVNCAMLSGDVSQNRRLSILEEFRSGKIQAVVATDVAGRGIQVDNVTHVFNYDLPYEAEDYVHRIGRTARAGKQGRAISFASEDAAFVIPEIESYIGRTLPITQPEEEMLVMPKPVASPPPKSPRPEGARHRDGGGRSGFGGNRKEFNRNGGYGGGYPRKRPAPRGN